MSCRIRDELSITLVLAWHHQIDTKQVWMVWGFQLMRFLAETIVSSNSPINIERRKQIDWKVLPFSLPSARALAFRSVEMLLIDAFAQTKAVNAVHRVSEIDRSRLMTIHNNLTQQMPDIHWSIIYSKYSALMTEASVDWTAILFNLATDLWINCCGDLHGMAVKVASKKMTCKLLSWWRQ